jgi:hypothetical protein
MGMFRQLTKEPGATIDDDDKILRLAGVASDAGYSSTRDPRLCSNVALVAKIAGRTAQVWIRSGVLARLLSRNAPRFRGQAKPITKHVF